MTEFGTFRIRIQRLILFESVFHSVTQRRLVGLEFNEKIRTFTPYPVYDVLLHGHGVGCHNLSGKTEFVNKLWDSLYLIAFLRTSLCSQRYACVERVSRHDIRISPVLQNRATLGVAVNTDYLPVPGSAPQLSMKHFDKFLHPVGLGTVIYAVIHTAKGRFKRHPIFQHPHFTEPFDIVFDESNYIGTTDISGGTAKYHQHYDIPESVTVVSLAYSAEIGH